MTDYRLYVVFDDGTEMIYDVKPDIAAIPSYENLKTVYGLFNQVRLDTSRTVVYWNDEIDLPSDEIYEYGEVITK